MTTDAYAPGTPYTVAGTGPYAVPFEYASGDDLVVIVRLDETSTEFQLSNGFEFTANPAKLATSGAVTLTAEAAAEYAGAQLVIDRATQLEQGWASQGNSREAGLEVALDRTLRGVQENRRDALRALRVSASDLTIGTLPLAAARAGMFLAFAATGAPIASAAPTIGAVDGQRVSSYTAISALDVTALTSVIYTDGYGLPGDGGHGRWRRVASEPAHLGKAQDANNDWWELSPELGAISPRQFGAGGAGLTDDGPALVAAVEAAAALGTKVILDGCFGVTSPWTIRNIIHVEGVIGSDVLLMRSCIVKLPGFTGAAAVIIGDGGVSPTAGTTLENFNVFGYGQDGDGVFVDQSGIVTIRHVGSIGHRQGWGFNIDGVFFPRLEYCFAYDCGSNANAVGGGYLLGHVRRETSDGILLECNCNNVEHYGLKMQRHGATSGLRQVKWRIRGGEYGSDAGSIANMAIAGDFVDLDGVGTGFTNNDPTTAAVIIGDAADTQVNERISLRNMTIFTNFASLVPAIRVAGKIDDLSIRRIRKTGVGPLIEIDPAAEISGGIDIDAQFSSGGVAGLPDDRRLHNLPAAWVGRPPQAVGGVVVRALDDGDELHMDTHDADGNLVRSSFTPFKLNLFRRVAMNLPPQSAAPANPAVGDFAYSDGTSGDAFSAGGEGLYVRKTGGWAFVA